MCYSGRGGEAEIVPVEGATKLTDLSWGLRRFFGTNSFLRILHSESFTFVGCEPFSPLQPSKKPETPNLSEICPRDCFGGFQSGELKFGIICQNLSENYRFSNFKLFQISVPLTGTPKNNRWDKFRTNLRFRAFLKAVGGKRVRNSWESIP